MRFSAKPRFDPIHLCIGSENFDHTSKIHLSPDLIHLCFGSHNFDHTSNIHIFPDQCRENSWGGVCWCEGCFRHHNELIGDLWYIFDQKFRYVKYTIYIYIQKEWTYIMLMLLHCMPRPQLTTNKLIYRAWC